MKCPVCRTRVKFSTYLTSERCFECEKCKSILQRDNDRSRLIFLVYIGFFLLIKYFYGASYLLFFLYLIFIALTDFLFVSKAKFSGK